MAPRVGVAAPHEHAHVDRLVEGRRRDRARQAHEREHHADDADEHDHGRGTEQAHEERRRHGDQVARRHGAVDDREDAGEEGEAEEHAPTLRPGTGQARGLASTATDDPLMEGPAVAPAENAPAPVKTLISPSRYVQGKGAMTRLGEFVAAIGSRPLLVVDDVVWGLTEGTVRASFAEHDLRVERVGFGRFATPSAVEELVGTIRGTDADVVIGIGGGSAIDAVKAAGHDAGIRWVSAPTAASTDAPTSALAVIYSEEGEFLEYRFFPRNPDLVLVDTQLVAGAPVEFLVAGVGDALATWLEARATRRSSATTMAGGHPTETGTALAELSWRLIHENALPAIDAARAGLVTPALERLVEANVLLSGLGFESGGLAAAHAIHNGLTAAPQAHGLTHGQKVNIGSLAQLVMEGAPAAEIEDFVVFTTKVGLPNTLTEIGLTPDDEAELQAVAEAACVPDETIHSMPFPVTTDLVVDALKAIEGLSRRIRAEHGLPEPELYRAGH